MSDSIVLALQPESLQSEFSRDLCDFYTRQLPGALQSFINTHADGKVVP